MTGANLQTTTADEFTTSDGARLRVVDEGPADAPVTVVLVHGWTLTKHLWDRVVTGLPAASGVEVRTIRYDLRGHGESDPAQPGSASIRRCADDLAELIAERVPVGPVVLAGHSMGGMTIMALAERHPELVRQRVAGVALVATSSGDLAAPTLGLPAPVAALANRGERVVRKRLAAARGKRLSPQSSWMRPGMRWLLFGTGPEARDVAVTADWVAACHPANMAAYREALIDHDRLDALAVLRDIPTVVLSGLADRLTPHTHSRRIAEALPDAKLLIYAGAGHMLPLERTAEVTDRIAELVARATG
ncbi:Pimeloyl-ACP methyl ester carboxylesterase [Saccharopolyspora kobensis]|uniref:Pimeloyl-ACP methyl ester carboxylesterase n=1 Tax=Saccharopolyspora kobensis TaxID=146035 RepID=A0A1H6CXP9_9PSEU|nr:alpha/beta hydrolase [Saccharopolyspora kobensis]SEG77538.1 Pimeloyl-ACP methyl ester carboxylesterase [Saccharopolyspora kobensis]SFD02680.1 Pimeloyl-ACP methyl ester carboxylesterase [Saccharopolyspora kobensis]